MSIEKAIKATVQDLKHGSRSWGDGTEAYFMPVLEIFLSNIEVEGFVLVPKEDLTTLLCNCSDAMENETTSSVYDRSGEPSTWFDHHSEAEKRILRMIEKAQNHDS